MADSISAQMLRSSTSSRWKLSRRKSALRMPALPSYTPKKEICLCFALVLVRLVTMQMRSSLQLSMGPECELAEQPLMIPQDLEEILDLSITSGCTVFCDYISSFMSLSCSLKDEELGRSNCRCPFTYTGELLASLFLRIEKPDCERWYSFSKAPEVARMVRSFCSLMARLSISTFESATMALFMRVELLSVGKLVSMVVFLVECERGLSLRSICITRCQLMMFGYIYYLIAVMLGRLLQAVRTTVPKTMGVGRFASAPLVPVKSVQMEINSAMMKITAISNFHIYNLLRVLEKSECMTESENELLASQNTLLAQGISLTNLISTVAKSTPQPAHSTA